MKIFATLFFTLAASAFAQSGSRNHHDLLGPLFNAAPQVNSPATQAPRTGLDAVRRWNTIALNATGLDHTPVAPGENRVFGEQLGPGRASRAMAIVHIAIFDVVNALNEQYQSFTGIDSAPHPLSIRAAVAQAAHDTLAALYRSQKSIFDQALAEDLLRITSERQKTNGIAVGKQIAAAILASRV